MLTWIDFAAESNRIEGIKGFAAHDMHARALKKLVDSPEVTVAVVERFVASVAGAPLRDKFGMDVRVGDHTPMSGGPDVRDELASLLETATSGDETPFDTHRDYEDLHPFMDGNGRSGRALWLWQMVHQHGWDPSDLPRLFLHEFYYQALSNY